MKLVCKVRARDPWTKRNVAYMKKCFSKARQVQMLFVHFVACYLSIVTFYHIGLVDGGSFV